MSAKPERVPRGRPGALTSVLWSVGLPFWIISLGMTYLGIVLAGKALLPPWQGALALVAAGPMLTGATCLYNDMIDRRADHHNPRKQNSALRSNRLRPSEAMRGARALAIGCVLLGALVNAEVLLLLVAALLLSFLYSNPGARLKSRPPADVLVNVIGIGALLPLIGWASLRPLATFPWQFLPTTLLGIGGLYLLTLAADLPADSRAGIRSTAVWLGPTTTLRGAVVAVASTGAALILVSHRWPNDPLQPQLLDAFWPMFVVQLAAMGVLLRQATARTVMTTIVFLGAVYILGVGSFVVLSGSSLLGG